MPGIYKCEINQAKLYSCTQNLYVWVRHDKCRREYKEVSIIPYSGVLVARNTCSSGGKVSGLKFSCFCSISNAW